MKKISHLLFALLTVISFAIASFAVASSDSKNSKTENGYEVHFNAFSTSFLTKEVAKQYQIGRSKTRGMLNIAVLKQQGDKVSVPVDAHISIKAQNFYGQDKEVELRKVSENDGAIYYIGSFTVSSREIIIFKAQVIPDGSNKVIEIKFDQEFFTD
ncbi:MAG: DUF4426 domain-containing protein [Proteobacteria bacterium]|nr:DUF4426 domain-containing protein [Pseudomonadota bacterium]